MQQDTPWTDDAARTNAESVFAAYVRQADDGLHPQSEQTLLIRLAGAIRPVAPQGALSAIIDAANAVLDAWEQRDRTIRGPCVIAIESATDMVRMDKV